MNARSLSETLKLAKEDASVFIRLEAGKSVRLHIISPAKAFAHIYFDSPPYDGAPKTMNVPFGTTIPGYTIRPQWAFEVIHLDSGAHRLLACGAGLAEDVLDADRSFRPKDKKDVEGAGFPRLDIVIERKGSGRKTQWTCIGLPTVYAGERSPCIDMDAHIRIAPPETLAKLPSAVPQPRVAPAKADLIRDMARKLAFPPAALRIIVRCKFGKGEVGELTDAESGLLIDILEQA